MGQFIALLGRKLGHCPTGEARITVGFNLPAKYVIHAVGPVYGTPDAATKLAAVHRYSLQLAREHEVRTIAFPAISTGAYGYPVQQAARIALGTCCAVIKAHPSQFETVRFVLFTSHVLEVFNLTLEQIA